MLEAWLAVQRNWLYLQPIFESPDINKQVGSRSTWCSRVPARKNTSFCQRVPGDHGSDVTLREITES